MSSNAVQSYNPGSLRLIDRGDPTPEEIEVIKVTVMPPGSTDAELQAYLGWCRWQGLDPVGQAYVIRQKNRDGTSRLLFGTSIHGMRAIAARTGLYGPQDGPYWCSDDGQWRDLWLSKDHPAAARVGVKQVGWDTYTYGTATWTQSGKAFGNWLTMPAHMLAIRAEADALRRAFPHDLAGVYTRDELEDAPDISYVTAPSRGVTASVVDQDTGEIIEVEPLPRITKAQAEEITALKKAMGWTAQFVRSLANQTVGKEDSRELTEEEAGLLIEVMREETEKELQAGLPA